MNPKQPLVNPTLEPGRTASEEGRRRPLKPLEAHQPSLSLCACVRMVLGDYQKRPVYQSECSRLGVWEGGS
ncbi:hypothetical protein L596_001554 [Steinernema carpocapsae]|uniref:Uncharacterized protein n=1 Tax=Steinernema carpocapsae TaxID=34508 RepID=A0A4V6I7E9_STECR|nr:hypothetical protein L596_001554 [Steinernema carpocapsae]